jgi:hypothetical protein
MTPPEWRRRTCPRDVLSLDLGKEAIAHGGLARQPRGVYLGVVPSDVDPSGQYSQGPGTQRKTSPATATWQTDGNDR